MFIAAQHTQTRASNTTLHSATRQYILTPIMAVVSPVLFLCQKIFDILNKASDVAQLALLTIINSKLGPQIPGGISGLLQTLFNGFNKLADWLHLYRALNILTFIMTVQNVYFLCDSLKVVTLQMISDTLAVFGINDKDNNPLNLNEILGHEVEELLKSVL